jgi:pimeloyl-ACP methyl ester carboxylesterase
MSTIFIVIVLFICVLVAASVVLSRTTYEVRSARDTEYLELEGNWIRYRVTGGGPPVVLVHGWLSSGRIWEQIADRLAQRFTVYTLDLAGFGDSDKPISGYGVRYGSRLLYAFCAHFGLTHAAVIGHDVGGAMAVKLAADHPDVAGRLVLIATPADENQVDLPTLLWIATMPVVGPVFYTLGRLLKPLRRLWMRPFVFDTDELTDEVVDDAGKSTSAAVTKTLDVMRREIARGRLVRQAGIVKVPVLVVAGEEDQIVDPQAADEWARATSAEVVFLDECGHMPMIERTAEFNARVLAFLTGDSRYLDAIAEAPEETVVGEDEDITVEERFEERPPVSHSKPDVPETETPETETPEPGTPEPGTPEPKGSAARGEPPRVVRKQDGRYPPRNRDREDAEDQSDASSETTAGNGSEARSGSPRDRAANGDDVRGPLPEVPEDLFEWPELKEPRSWDRSRETGGPVREERDEDTDPEDPEEKPPRS